MEQHETPLFDMLMQHRQKDPVSLHVPGHKYGKLLDDPKYAAFHGILQLDATELSGLDDLHQPEGVIREAEWLLSEAYGTEKSYFLVNGSTVGNLAMLLAVLQKDDLVLVQRNCHKSILNGIEMAEAKAVFLGPEYNEEWGVSGGISQEIVARALALYPTAKALIVTYPNYYGMVNELQEMIKQAHGAGIPVLVDEAHGAHFISGGLFPQSAVTLGADVVVQSAHKTLPAMTMGSYLHLNSKWVDQDRLEHYLRILQSSSPSYPIMASLDIARSYIATYSEADHAYLHEELTHFIGKLSENDGIKVLNNCVKKGDPLKITLQSQTELTGFEMQEAFERERIFTELADPYNVLLVVPLLKKGMDFPFTEVIKGITRALQPLKRKRCIVAKSDYEPTVSMLDVSFEEMKHLKRRKVPLQAAIGEIAAERVTPYPPGIPLLFPGERISSSVIAEIQRLVDTKARFQEGGSICQREISIYVRY